MKNWSNIKIEQNKTLANGAADADACIEFVTNYNEFINYEPKPFEIMIERDFRL